MKRRPFSGKWILIAEDDFVIGQDLRKAVEDEGASVWGPVSSENVASWAVTGVHLDGALLDVVLREGTAGPVALQLRARHIPFVIVSAHSPDTLPPDLRDVPLVPKPYRLNDLLRAAREAFNGRL